MEGELSRDPECSLCNESKERIGFQSKYGSITVYRSGDSPKQDWFVTLQPKTQNNPETGYTLMLMPLAHLASFAEINTSEELAHRFGQTLGLVSYVAQKIAQKQARDLNYHFPQVIFGKCNTSDNTKDHIHLKVYEYSGGVAQPSPTDTNWLKNPATPVTKTRLSQERLEDLADKFIQLTK